MEAIGRVTSKSVLKHTGKDWLAWVKILDRAGAKNFDRKEIVALLVKKYKLSLWWRQIVASGYEIHIWRRIEGQNLKGEYSIIATKTFNVDKKLAWRLLTSPEGLAVWLQPLSSFQIKPKSQYEVSGDVFGEVRTLRIGVRLRMTWQETAWPKPTIIQTLIVGRPKGKCIVAIQHDHLRSVALREKMRAHWKLALINLAAFADKHQF